MEGRGLRRQNACAYVFAAQCPGGESGSAASRQCGRRCASSWLNTSRRLLRDVRCSRGAGWEHWQAVRGKLAAEQRRRRVRCAEAKANRSAENVGQERAQEGEEAEQGRREEEAEEG
eukprot:1532668-Rhodomonas_salina.1